MRRVMAIACGALLALSVPAFAQSTVTSQSPAAQPSGGSVVNYQNGLDALGQAPPENPTGFSNTELLVGLGVAGAAGLTAALIASNQNSSTNNSSPSVSP